MMHVLRVAGWSLLNIRYGSLILPSGVVAYLLGLPAWLVATTAGLLGVAVALEVFGAVVGGRHTAAQQRAAQEASEQYLADIERYANAWAGSDDGPDDDGPDADPVPAKLS